MWGSNQPMRNNEHTFSAPTPFGKKKKKKKTVTGKVGEDVRGSRIVMN